MPTRRVILECALLEERLALWADLSDSLGVDPYSGHVSDLIRRIRAASEALGYPSDWLLLPLPALRWVDLVENVPLLGIVSSVVDWDDANFTAESRNIDFHPCDADHREFHRHRGAP